MNFLNQWHYILYKEKNAPRFELFSASLSWLKKKEKVFKIMRFAILSKRAIVSDVSLRCVEVILRECKNLKRENKN